MEQYKVTGMSCAACSARVEKAVAKVRGVKFCSVSLLTNSMGVEGTADPAAIIKAVEDAGYGAMKKETSRRGAVDESSVGMTAGETETDVMVEASDMLIDQETPLLKKRLELSIGFLVVLMYVSMGHMMWGWPLPAFFEENHVAMGLLQMILTIIIIYRINFVNCKTEKFFK